MRFCNVHVCVSAAAAVVVVVVAAVVVAAVVVEAVVVEAVVSAPQLLLRLLPALFLVSRSLPTLWLRACQPARLTCAMRSCMRTLHPPRSSTSPSSAG